MTKEITDIKSPEIIYVMKTIKAIQSRMKDPDMINLPYIRVYDTLGKEFSYFADTDKYIKIFSLVIRGEKMKTIAEILYFRDQVLQGRITEAEVSKMLEKRFLTKEQREAASVGLKKLQDSGQI